jgi:hypothetical protein
LVADSVHRELDLKRLKAPLSLAQWAERGAFNVAPIQIENLAD